MFRKIKNEYWTQNFPHHYKHSLYSKGKNYHEPGECQTNEENIIGKLQVKQINELFYSSALIVIDAIKWDWWMRKIRKDNVQHRSKYHNTRWYFMLEPKIWLLIEYD